MLIASIYKDYDNTKFKEHNGRTVDYTYDELYRLTKEVVAGDPEGEDVTIEYAYDKVGNRQSQKVTNSSGTVETTYTYDHNDRLTHEHIDGTLSRTYTYDDNGNLDTVDIEEQPGAVDIDYTWDAENRLTAVAIHDGQGGTQNIAYEYDAQGVRVSKTVDGVETKYLIDPMRPYAQVLEEYTGEGATRDVQTSYTYGNDLIGQDQDGTDFFYLEDIHSGVRQMTNSSGVVTDTYEYDAYGNLLAETGSTVNNYLYRGEQMDGDMDLQYLRARYYDPATGRFVSTDPFEGYLELPISRHRYLYANANPVTYVDPSGLTSLVTMSGVLEVIATLATLTSSLAISQYFGFRRMYDAGSDDIEWTGVVADLSIGLKSKNGGKKHPLVEFSVGLAGRMFFANSEPFASVEPGMYGKNDVIFTRYVDAPIAVISGNASINRPTVTEPFGPFDSSAGTFIMHSPRAMTEFQGTWPMSGGFLAGSLFNYRRAPGTIGYGKEPFIMAASKGNTDG